ARAAKHDDRGPHCPGTQYSFRLLIFQLQANAPHAVAQEKIRVKRSQAVCRRLSLQAIVFGHRAFELYGGSLSEGGTQASQDTLAKSMKPLATSVWMSLTRTWSPTSRPSKLLTTLPSAVASAILTHVPFSEAPVTIPSNC